MATKNDKFKNRHIAKVLAKRPHTNKNGGLSSAQNVLMQMYKRSGK